MEGRQDATNLSITIKLVSVALTERGAKWELSGPMYVQVGPEFLPESVLEVYEMCATKVFVHPARSKESQGEVVLACQLDSLQHQHAYSLHYGLT